jgi:serine/threonine protein kinase
MEFVDGESVHSMLRREGKLAVSKTLDIAISVCEALAHAADHRVVHQDIKPHNIMVDKRGTVKLADLGLATIGGRSKPASKKPGVLMGSPHFMAPEQSQHGKVDTRTDIYALGASLFYMLTGRVPFEGPNSLVILTKHITQDRPDPRELNVTSPDALAGLVMKMMAVASADRPSDPKELGAKLKQIKVEHLKAEEDSARRKGSGQAVVKKRALLSPDDDDDDYDSEAPAIHRSRAPESREAAPTKSSKPVNTAISLAALALLLLGVLYIALKVVAIFNAPPPPSASGKSVPPARVPHQTPDPDPRTVSGRKIQVEPSTPVSGPVSAQTEAAADALKELQRALDARDRAMQSGNFSGAVSALISRQANP